MTSGPTDAAPRSCPGCSHGVDRRTFLSAATLAAVAAAFEACSGLTSPGGSGFSGSYGGPFTVVVGNYGALSAIGGVARVDNGSGAPTALYRSSSSGFIALAMICTHAGYSPIEITSGGFFCPVHGSSFAKSGAVQGGPAPSGLATFPTTYNAATDTVTVNRPS